MELNEKDLVKSLTSLIDETLEEIEEIKKSKYAASEIKIEGPGQGIAGKPVNGDLSAKKKEDEDEEEEKEEAEKADCDMDKGENEKADPDAGKFAQAPTVSKGEDEEEGEEEESEEDEEKEEKEEKKMKKSLEESESLMKSYVDTKFSALEERLSKMADMIEALADAPAPRRGVPAGFQALQKSVEDTEAQPLTKSDVANKLFELKKSGTYVDSSDIFAAETSKNYGELKQIADKYGVK